MKVEAVMKTRVATVTLDDSLQVVREIFDQAPFRHLLVVDDDGRLAGVISDRDLLTAISPYLGMPGELARDRQTLGLKSHQIMTRDPTTVHPRVDIREAANRLLSIQGSCLPVVDGENRIKGILSWKDLLRALNQPADARYTPT